LKELFNQNNAKDKIPINAVFTNCLGAPVKFFSSKEFQPVSTEAHSDGVVIDCIVSAHDDTLVVEWMVLNNTISTHISEKMFDEFKLLMDLIIQDSKMLMKSIYELKLRDTKRTRTFLVNNTEQLSKEKFMEIVYDSNKTDTLYDKEVLIHELFERRVSENEKNIALITNKETLTYGELNKRANILANELKDIVKPQQSIGLYLPQGHEFVVAILAILKLGAIYVPINIQDPVERIKSIIKTADVQLLLTDEKSSEKKNQIEDLSFFNINEINFDDANCLNMLNIKRNGCSSDIAYIIFTSGSTGVPKGVMVQHKPIVNLIEWAQTAFKFNSNDRVILLNPVNFDLSVFDIFGMLAYGASIRIVENEERHNPYKLIDIMNNEQITFWNTAPAYYQILSSVLKTKNVLNKTMRLFFLSGDWIPQDIFNQVNTYFPNAKIIGLGGATEATVWSNYFEITAEKNYECNSIPYGKPIQNTRYYILNNDYSPCDIGQSGTLFIGGECLSKGYVSNERLSRQVFIRDPFHEKDGMVMYNTGDVARYMSDKNIEFLGRLDAQVKIRGYRVEIGEVENALQSAGIENAVVVVDTDEANRKKLIGFGQLPGFSGRVEDFDIQEKIARRLPDYMIPPEIYAVDEIPLTANGKIDTKKLIQVAGKNNQIREQKIEDSEEIDRKNVYDVEDIVCTAINKILEKTSKLDTSVNLGHIGFSSLQYVLLGVELSEKIQIEINPALFFKYTTPKEIIMFLEEKFLKSENETKKDFKKDSLTANVDEQKRVNETDIAVIGISCKLPNAENITEFWNNLLTGDINKKIIPEERWDVNSLHETDVVHGNFIEGIKNFDSDFFSISPREAKTMDPRQRILLQSVWHALEDAGYSRSMLQGSDTGFFVGSTGHDYEKRVFANKAIDELSLMGISKTIIPNRISYYYDWHGPSEVVDTACSSSLVAVHHAVKSIHNNECSMALAGGINLIIDPETHVSLDKIGMLAKDGISKTFDKSGNGYARGEGAIIMVLKPLTKAIKDKDNIHAVIKSTAINHGGKSNGLTAPNMKAQIDVITKAYTAADINPEQIGYIETHGTGTALGDPIEVEAIKEAIYQVYARKNLAQNNNIMLGAVKPNIGHLEAAAGIAGLLKLVLTIKNKKMPPNIYPQILNPNIDIAKTKFVINSDETVWERPISSTGETLSRVGGVSSFGFGGVNVHVAIEEYEKKSANEVAGADEYIFVLSANSQYSLDALIKKYRTYLRKNRNISMINMCYTLQLGREHLSNRFAIIAKTVDDILFGLDNYCNKKNDGFIIGNINQQTNKITYLNDSIDYARVNNENRAMLWIYGMRIPLSVEYENKKWEKISLPQYQFVPKEYWLENKEFTESINQNYEKDVLSEHTNLQPSMMEISLTGQEQFIAQHVIKGEKVLPGAAYVPYIQYAGGFQPPFVIENLAWLSIVSERMLPLKIQVAVKTVENKKDIEFFTKIENKTRLLCAAKISEMGTETPATISIEAVKEQCTLKYMKEKFYTLFAQNDIVYGNMFQGIEQVWLSADGEEILGKIQFNEFAKNLDVAPTILDCALQLSVFSKLITRHGENWYPFSVEKIKCYRKLESDGYVYLKKKAGQNIDKTDLFITDKAGQVVMEIESCIGRKAKSSTNLFKTAWVIEHNDSSTTEEDKRYLGENTQVTLLLNQNAHFPALTKNLNFHINATSNQSGIKVSSTNLTKKFIGRDLNNDMLTELSSSNKFINNVICFASENSLEMMYKISKLMYKTKENVAVFIVDTENNAVASAKMHSLIAWGKVLEKENSRFNVFYLKIAPKDVDLTEIIGRIRKNSLSHEFLLDAHGTLLSKRIESLSFDMTKNERLTQFKIKKMMPYLITGGLGKIGQEVAQIIANHGGIPILVGRTKESNKTSSLVQAIDRAHYYSCDVSKVGEIKHLIKLTTKKFGPIKGVFHCAGINNDKFLHGKEFVDVLDVVSPKVEGVLALDEATKDITLDFFVMFSSIASTLCNIGQTDYAYANMFMDNFSEIRNQYVKTKRRTGKSISLSWPFIKNAGMPMDGALLEKMELETGITYLNITDIRKFLLQDYDASHVNIIPGNGSKIFKYLNENN